MTFTIKYKILLAGALSWGFLPFRLAKAEPIAVVGWPGLELNAKEPAAWLGDDPIFGRLACPPLSRLNLLQGRSEGLFFHDVVEEKHPGAKVVWTYPIRAGLFWWDGSPISAADVAAFMQAQLPKVIEEKSKAFPWKTPQWSVAYAAKDVTISWQTQPNFGPYVFNGVSLWRENKKELASKSGFAYECAGIYRPSLSKDGIALEPAPGYKMPRQALFVVSESQHKAFASQKDRFLFKFPEVLSVNPSERPPAVPASCKMPVDVPLLSAISWNTQSPKLKNEKLRGILTNLTPRGAFLRAGAGHWGDLVSSVVPRNHPGYNHRVLVRPFNFDDGVQALSKLGYKRPVANKDRLDPQDRPFSLNLASLRPELGLVEKVLIDSFMAVGIHTYFVDAKDEKNRANIDGVVTGLYLPWPGMDLSKTFHSKASPSYPFWHLDLPALDKELEAHALTLTLQTPSFEHLQKIHNLLFQAEPITVIMQHRACLEIAGSAASPGAATKIDVRDPDWFRRLVLGGGGSPVVRGQAPEPVRSL